MSILCTLTTASPEQLTELIASPHLVERFLFGPPPPTLRSRLRSLLANTTASEPPWLTVPPPQHYDLEKAWDGVRFLLTGVTDPSSDTFPAGFLGVGGTPLGSAGFGYGPVRAISASEAVAVNHFLGSQSLAQLEARFDPVRFSSQHIYPGTIWHSERARTIDWLLYHFGALRDFVAATVERRAGLLVHFS